MASRERVSRLDLVGVELRFAIGISALHRKYREPTPRTDRAPASWHRARETWNGLPSFWTGHSAPLPRNTGRPSRTRILDPPTKSSGSEQTEQTQDNLSPYI